ncbi:MAG: VWA domain-containing protein [Gammaproteobacteria bacterium]|nr:VWA domain-containing protein [Gammaproteobacteria bacterium]
MPVYFEQPYWFMAFPVMIVIYLILSRLTRLAKKTNSLHMISVYLPSFTDDAINATTQRHKTDWINWLLLLLMITALAQPVSREKKETVPDSLRDIIFVIDTSVGMSIRDYTLESDTIDRLTLLKAVLTNFIGSLEGNRIALMLYADEAYSLIPLTRDKTLLNHGINRIQMATAGRQNNLSNALISVINQYDFSVKKPSIVVLSQGANIEGVISPHDVAKDFKEKNIKLHFIGLGSRQQKHDDKSKLIFDAIDMKLLQSMAATTGGEFFWAGESASLNSILAAIKDTESIDVQKADYYLLTNFYMYSLYAVVFISVLIHLLNLLQRRRQ